jgi:hypothetical protein
MRLTFAIAAIAVLATDLGPASAFAVNTADAGVQIATARAREVPSGAALHSKTGENLGVIVRVVQGKRGYVEDLYVRDTTGVIRRVPSLSVYRRQGRFVTSLTPAEFRSVPDRLISRR